MTDKNYFNKVNETAKWLEDRISIKPKIIVGLSGGLKGFIDALEKRVKIPSRDIPNFPVSNVEGHEGILHFGTFNGVSVVVMDGRYHYYDGHSPQTVVFPYFVFNKMGVKFFISTNAVGGIRKDLLPGDIMIITDHINMTGNNPLMGIATLKKSDQFTNMIDAYDPDLQKLAKKTAKSLNLKLKEGVFIGVSGPSYETRAEIGAFRSMGADSVGMSTVMEVIASRFLDMRVLCFACVANRAADLHEGELSHSEVLTAMKRMSPNVVKLLKGVIKNLRV